MTIVNIESSFAKRLASNNPKLRRKAVKSLKKWISNKSSSGNELSDDELMKFWKGLFYCMWMCDKALVQEELAENLSQFIHAFNSLEESLNFVNAFFQSLSKEWFSLDRFRIEKYLMFVRCMVREMLTLVLSKKKQKLVRIQTMNKMLSKTVFDYKKDPICPVSLSTHVVDLYLEEAKFVTKGKLTPKAILKIIRPFLMITAFSKRYTLLTHIQQSIFDAILDDTTWHHMQEKVNNEDDEDSDEEFQYLDIKFKSFTHHSKQDIPPLKADCIAIAKVLMKIAKKPEIISKNRNICYNVVKRLENAASGHDNLVTKVKINIDDNKKTRINSAIDDLVNDAHVDKKIKRAWGRNIRQTELENKLKRKTESMENDDQSSKKMKNSDDNDEEESVIENNSTKVKVIKKKKPALGKNKKFNKRSKKLAS